MKEGEITRRRFVVGAMAGTAYLATGALTYGALESEFGVHKLNKELHAAGLRARTRRDEEMVEKMSDSRFEEALKGLMLIALSNIARGVGDELAKEMALLKKMRDVKRLTSIDNL